MSGWLSQDFHVSDLGIGTATLESPKQERSSSSTVKGKQQSLSFHAVREIVKQYFKEKHSKLSEAELNKWQNLQYEAVLGTPSAVEVFKEEIEAFLRKERIHLSPPYPYNSLVEALFQETFGLGAISTWWKHPRFPESQSARIILPNVYYDIPGERALQPYKYDSVTIDNLIEKLRLKDEFAAISKSKPKLEIDLADGTRVMIMISPRVRQPVIVFRNFTMKKPTLEQLVRTVTIPAEGLALIEGIARSMLNIAVLGKVRSGKSTFLKAMFAARYREGQVAVNIERTHAELRLQEMIPDGQIIEMIAKTDEDYEEIFDQVLRSDYHFCVVSELRSLEAEIYNLASERGEGGSMTTYHTDRVKNMPGQIARLILQRYPSRKYEEELIRVAENLDITFVMKELKDGAKRLDKICEIQLDPYSLEVQVVDLMRYEESEQDYRYYAGYSERFKQKLLEVEGYGESALQSLHRLAREKPILTNAVEVALSHVVKPREA